MAAAGHIYKNYINQTTYLTFNRVYDVKWFYTLEMNLCFYFIIHDEISDKANEHHPHYTSHKAFGILNIIIHRYELFYLILDSNIQK